MVIKTLLNKKAPKFNLQDNDGKLHSLKDIDSEYVVVYFYPKDNTPGCTIEANEFNKALLKFKKLDTTIIGISGGDEKSKTKFCTKHKLKLLLLSDTDAKVGKAYHSYGEKKFMGRTYMGFIRNTYILNKKRKIIKVFEKVKPIVHVNEVLDFLKSQK